MVDRLLTFARSDSGRLTMENEDIDLSALCEDIARQSYLAEERGVTVGARQVQTGDPCHRRRDDADQDHPQSDGQCDEIRRRRGRHRHSAGLSLNREQCDGAEMACCERRGQRTGDLSGGHGAHLGKVFQGGPLPQQRGLRAGTFHGGCAGKGPRRSCPCAKCTW